MAKIIVETHGGQAYFNFEQASKIIGCGRNTIAHCLYKSGVSVRKIGPSKRISAYDLAEFMHHSRIAPIDNTSRGA